MERNSIFIEFYHVGLISTTNTILFIILCAGQGSSGGRQGRVPEPTQRAEIRKSAVTDSRHQITAIDGCCKVR